MLRAARPDDADALARIERAAGARYVDVGLAEVAAAEPMATDRLAAYARAGRSWVVVDDDDRPVGYVVVDLVDGSAHVEQLSVEPAHQGRGHARALLDLVGRWAAERLMAAVTLTTFAEVPWNRPLYEHLGFVVLRPEEIPAGLRAVRDAETAHGLDPAARVCMRRAAGPPPGPLP